MSADLADVIDRMAAKGWDKFDAPARKKTQALPDPLRVEAATIAGAFRTDAGKRALRLLIERIVLAPEYQFEADQGFTAEQVALRAAYRQGQKQTVAFILRAIAIDGGEKPPGGENG